MDSTTVLHRNGRTTRDSTYDFATLYGNKSRFIVPQANLGSFYLDYCIAVRDAMREGRHVPLEDGAKNKKRAILGIAQKPSRSIPVVIDLNLKFNTEPIGEPYDDFFLRRIIASIQAVLAESYIVDQSQDSNDLVCAVSEWSNSIQINDDRVTHGNHQTFMYKIRFHFPFCRVSGESISRLISPIAMHLRSINAFGSLEQTPIGDWDRILKALINEPIPLYGSSEREDYPMLRFNSVYDNLIHANLDEDIPALPLNEVFQVECHSLVETRLIDPSIFESLSIEELLPFFLSNNYRATPIPSREIEVTPSFTSDEIPNSFGRRNENTVFVDKMKIEIATELLPLISTERFLKRMSWIDIGKALHESCEGTDEGLHMWIQATEAALNKVKMRPDFLMERSISEVSSDEYNMFETPGIITVKTIAWYAQEDSPVQYKNWHFNWAMPYREAALDLTHFSVAKAFFCDTWLKYCCSSVSKKEVYVFRSHRWVKIDGGYLLRISLSEDFKRSFEEIRARLAQQSFESHDAAYKADMQIVLEKLNLLIRKLGERPFKRQVMDDLLDLLHIERFEESTDINGNLTGHPNGVTEVDYSNKIIEFRSGKPEDYITRTTLVRMCSDMSWSHPRVVDFMEWMEKMFVDDDTREFVLKFLASGFIAGNLDKILPIFSGDKNNGKSTFVRLLMKTWGSYSVKFPTTGLTRGYSDSGAPNPAWARLAHVRWGISDEPDEDENFRSGPTKLITGGDAMYTRKLFSDGGDMEATATVFMCANRVPGFPNADEASKYRFCLIPCRSTWVATSEAPVDEEEQFEQRLFPMDKDFINRVRLLAPAMLWVSYQYFVRWSEEGLEKRSQEIIDATNQYWDENDIYLMYMNDRLDVADPSQFVTVTQMYNDFEIWYVKYNKNAAVPGRNTMRYHMIQRMDKCFNDCWHGISIKGDNMNMASMMTDSLVNTSGKAARSKPEFSIVPKIETQVAQPKLDLDFRLGLGLPTISESQNKILGARMEDGKLVPIQDPSSNLGILGTLDATAAF